MAEVHGNRTHSENAGKTGIPVQGGAESGALDADSSPIGDDLQSIIDRWPGLSEAVRESILAIVQGTSKRGEGVK